MYGLTENAGHENDGPKLTAGRKVAEAEIQFNGATITMKCANS